jgi:UDP-2,3-diacylglucosamine hydrolase
MSDYTRIPATEAFFLADFHFRDNRLADEALRRRWFGEFMSAVPSGAAVFLLGDIFDFYFEYASVVPNRYFDVLRSLSNSALRGVDIHFVAGNHDAWYTDFLKNEVGVTPHADDAFIEIQGRRVWCTHGDLLVPGDRSYKVIRSIIRNRVVVAAARALLHPDLMSAIALRVSDGSKKRNRRSVEAMARQLIARPSSDFFSKGNDATMMGHIHYPVHHVTDGKELVVVGDWISHFTFARLRDGRITLEKFKREGKD